MTELALPHARVGEGSPLVVFPGLGGRHGVPARLARWVQRLEIVELSGSRAVWSIHRRTGMEAGITVEDLAAEHAAMLRRLFDSPVDLVGVSTGGSIALQLVADHPELVRRLVIVSAAYTLSDQGRAMQRQVAALLRADRPRRAASLFLGNTGATVLTRALLRIAGLLAPRMVVGRRDPDLLVTLDAEDAFDLKSRLGQIETPTLITGGGRDRFYTAALFEATRAAMPNATLKVYARGGHVGTLGNRSLAQHILQFLERRGE